MTDYEYMRQKYASLEAQYFALVKAIADGLALQAPPRFVVSRDFTMPVEVAGSLEPGAMQMLVPSESVQFPVVLPIDMVLHCPKCHLQHIDMEDDTRGPIKCQRKPECNEPCGEWCGWTNPPHRSHLCSGCGRIWRPADVCTNGVAAVKTVGKNDSPLVVATPEIDECAANGDGHRFGPHGPHRERQCEWCGKEAPPANDDYRRGMDAGDVLGGGY